MPVDRLDPPTPLDSRPGEDGERRGWSSNMKMIIAVALVATVVGAAVGTGMTLLIGTPGPTGKVGPQGERGPEGPRGPSGDLSGIQDRVSNLASSVAGIDARLGRLESSAGSGDLQTEIDRLDARVSDLESFSNGLCSQLNIFC